MHISLEQAQQSADFVSLRSLSAQTGVVLDLRYASSNNFMGRDVYSPMDCAWLHRNAAQALARAQASLNSLAQGHRLLVLDALRPHRVQVALYASLVGTGLEQYLAHPDRGSIHSHGLAVDVSLLGPDGCELDMGTGFDAMEPASHPEFEADMLQNGRLSQTQVQNRQLLRQVLLPQGFVGISTEWWHFDHGDKSLIRERFARVD